MPGGIVEAQLCSCVQGDGEKSNGAHGWRLCESQPFSKQVYERLSDGYVEANKVHGGRSEG